MSLKIFFLILFSSSCLQKGWAQQAAIDTSKSVPGDTSQTSSSEVHASCISSPHDCVKMLKLRIGAGHAGEGLWIGGNETRPLYFFADSGKPGLTLHPSGKTSFGNSIHVNGTTTTKVLTIIGGADLAEPFPISEPNVPAGAVVVIDAQNSGTLRLCDTAYDTRVAGVISGASGINAGLVLKQEEALAEGRNVALSGRVYALASTVNGAIQPGDLLTTSGIPGHAMKATDRTLWSGAIVGKALSSLERGEGMILLLVNLQ